MSKSSPDHQPRPRPAHQSGRFLRLPDAVFHASAPPERRAPAVVLERAIGGGERSDSSRSTAGTQSVREPRTVAPPVRERVFSGELRSVTGAVMRHRSSSVGPSAKSRDRLVPPPPREKPWLRSGEVRRSRSAQSQPGQSKPWLKDSARGSGKDPAAGETAPSLKEYREYVLVEEAEFVTLEAESEVGSIAGAGWIVVTDEVPAVEPVEEVEPPTAAAPAAESLESVAPEAPAGDPQPIAETESGELIIESESDIPDEPEAVRTAETTPTALAIADPTVAVAVPDAQPELQQPGPAVPAASEIEAPATVEPERETPPPSEASVSAARPADVSTDEHVEYLEDEPLFMDARPEPFIQLPDFPETPAIFDVPAEVEPDHIATPPAEDEPEHIVELAENMLDPVGPYRDQFVPGIVVQYDVEYVDESADLFAYAPRMADPLAPSTGPAQQAVAEPEAVVEVVTPTTVVDPEPEPKDTSAVPEVVATAAVVTAAAVAEPEASADADAPGPHIEVVTREARTASSLNELSAENLDELGGNDRDSLKRELFQDIRRELHSDFAEEGLEPKLDLDLTETLDAQIEAGFSEEATVTAETEPARSDEVTQAELLADEMMPTPGSASEPESTDDADDLMLADDELMAHLSIEAPAAPQFSALVGEDAAALRQRLQQAWAGSAVPEAVSASGLAETLQRIYTDERPLREHFHGVLDVLLEKTRADGLSVLMLDTEQMVYRPLLDAELDARTATNFYLSVTDVRPDQHPEFEIRWRARGELARWQKRFSSAAFQQLEGVYLIPLHRLGLTAYLALVYNDMERATEHVLTSMLPPILRELVPALHRFAMVEWRGAETERVGMQRTEDTSIVDHIYRLLSEVSNGGREKIEVLHLHFPALLQETAWRVRLDRMAAAFLDHMTMMERLVEATPERITLILKQTSSAEMLRIAAEEAESNGLDLKTRVLRFPEHSRNMYNYISPGL